MAAVPLSPAHPLCPDDGWAVPLQWVPRQIHTVVSQGGGEPGARVSQREQGNESKVISRFPSKLQFQESQLGASVSTSFNALSVKQGVSPFCGQVQPTAGCHPSQPWHIPHTRVSRAKPLLKGTRRERQMVPGRKRLAQLRVIYLVPKVLLCISFYLLSSTQLPHTKPFASFPCPGREECRHLSRSCDGLHATKLHPWMLSRGRTASFRRKLPLPCCSTCTHGWAASLDIPKDRPAGDGAAGTSFWGSSGMFLKQEETERDRDLLAALI